MLLRRSWLSLCFKVGAEAFHVLENVVSGSIVQLYRLSWEKSIHAPSLVED